MKLSKRLQAVADLVSDGMRVADIGTDHGYIPIYLVQTGKCPNAIAMDVNKGPLLRATAHIQEEGLTMQIATRLSDGLSSLKEGECDCAVLAGMGGALVIKILEEGKNCALSLKELILQPQSELSKVRSYLLENGYQVVAEDMVEEDGKFYPMMKVVRGEADVDYTEKIPKSFERKLETESIKVSDIAWLFDEYGEWLLKEKNQTLLQFLLKEKNLYSDILENLENMDSLKSELRQKEIREKLRYINLGLEWFEDEMQ